MRRSANPGRWLSKATPRPSTSCYSRHAQFHSTPSQFRDEKNGVGTQSSQPPSGPEEDLGFTDWTEVNDQEKTVTTAVGDLPISPLLDPSWRQARERGAPKKIPPSPREMSRVQRKLYTNTYANMLSEPVRMCQLTRARLPRPFLQSFGLAKNPDTDEKWWIPSEIASGPPAAQRRDIETLRNLTGDSSRNKETEQFDDNFLSEDLSEELQEETNPPPGNPGRFWAPVYILGRQDLLTSFHDRNSKYSAGHMRFAGHPSVGTMAYNAVWRKDMDNVILEERRRDIAWQLEYLAGLTVELNRTYLSIPMDARESEKDMHLEKKGDTVMSGDRPVATRKSAQQIKLAWLQVWDSEVEGDDKGDDSGTASTAPSPSPSPPFAPFTISTDDLPMYHLPSLLGPKLTETMIEKAPDLFKPNQWLILQGKKAEDLAGKLWRLQGFSADYSLLK